MLLTKQEAADRLRCHTDTITRLINKGDLEAIKNDGRNGKVLVPEESIEAYLNARRVQVAK